MEPKHLTFRDLELLTNNFSEELMIGRGKHGKVYKGVSPSGQDIAVKLLHICRVGFDDAGFQKEFLKISKLRHRNLIGCVGHCFETRRVRKSYNGKEVFKEKTFRVLCFDYCPYGGLANHISEVSRGLDWDTSFNIIKGICEGLMYLHEAKEEPIYHLNLNPNNVLLDANMVPKLSGFGLIKLIHDYLSERPPDGAPAYWAPECINGRVASKAFDVFSLGAVLIEIITRKYYNTAISPQDLVDQAVKNWRERLKQSCGGSALDLFCHQVKICTEIALRCVDKDPRRRPNMGVIIHVLSRLDHMGVHPRDKVAQNYKDLFEQYVREVSSTDDMELSALERIRVDKSREPCPLPFPILKLITSNFLDQLRIGSGGCGEVYKGILRNGFIAVKKLFNSHTIEDKMFHQEVQNMLKITHPNIVRLLGYCSHTAEIAIKLPAEKDKQLPERTVMAQVRERLLCFEYISKGGLEKHLSDELRGLEWYTRYKIIRGICEGLYYLHKEKHLIHMDLKPANILLDHDMVPKISDFGLSRMDDKSKTLNAGRLLSLGYCPQEYLHDGNFSHKFDIYSMGVIITELVTGRKEKPTNAMQILRRWKKRWNKSRKQTLLVYQQVFMCLHLAIKCMHVDPMKRPDISDIICKLNKLDCTDEEADSAGESFAQQISDLEDMLWIEPLEMRSQFELNKQIKCEVELVNDTDDYFAFNFLKKTLRPYNIHPSIDIVQPRSKCTVTITLQPMEKAPVEEQCKDEFVVQSTRVPGSLKAEDITGDIFDEGPDRVVDKVDFTILLDVPLFENNALW